MKAAFVCTILIVSSQWALAQAATSPNSNSIIDLRIPSGEQAVVDAVVYDESVAFAPNFAIDQQDPALGDLFGTKGSELCFPTSLAEVLVFLQAYSKVLVPLPLAGLSADRTTIEPNALVRDLAQACHTKVETGTNDIEGLKCVLDLQKRAGLGVGHTSLIDPFSSDPTLPIRNREVRIADLRAALHTGHPVILLAAWFDFDPQTRTLKQNGGHYFSVFGYNYNKSWGEDLIQLKIINPLTSYGPVRVSHWDTITLSRVRPQAGIAFPAHRPFTISGSRFGGLKSRAFIGQLLLIAPN